MCANVPGSGQCLGSDPGLIMLDKHSTNRAPSLAAMSPLYIYQIKGQRAFGGSGSPTDGGSTLEITCLPGILALSAFKTHMGLVHTVIQVLRGRVNESGVRI